MMRTSFKMRNRRMMRIAYARVASGSMEAVSFGITLILREPSLFFFHSTAGSSLFFPEFQAALEDAKLTFNLLASTSPFPPAASSKISAKGKMDLEDHFSCELINHRLRTRISD